MNSEQLSCHPSRLESLQRTLEQSSETFNNLDASMLFLEVDFSSFKSAMIKLGKMGRTFSLVFVMDDMGKTIDEKRMRLRKLKAIREDSRLKSVVTKIVVTGKAGEAGIEPNVFSSGVDFKVHEK